MSVTETNVIYTDFGPRVDEQYLGDAVYASHDSQQIWLRTGDGNDQQIALDHATYNALVRYARSLNFKDPAP
jgi:hypothetical protein